MERWLRIDRFPCYDVSCYDVSCYDVSCYGRVYNNRRQCLVKSTADSGGYHRVKLTNHEGRFSVAVSRLVAGTFYQIDIVDLEVNHEDGNKNNNHIWNLEIVDRSEQMLHAFRTGLANPVHPALKIMIVETQEVFSSTGQVDRHLGVSNGSCSKTLRGLQKTCKGYTFELVGGDAK